MSVIGRECIKIADINNLNLGNTLLYLCMHVKDFQTVYLADLQIPINIFFNWKYISKPIDVYAFQKFRYGHRICHTCIKRKNQVRKKNSVMHGEGSLSLESERWIYFEQSIEFTEF
jgi:hypothetical protein